MSERRRDKRRQEGSLDLAFNIEWNFLKKKVLEEDLQLNDFHQLWGALIYANNDWRELPFGATFLYTKTQGLRRDNLAKYIENVDFFIGKTKLLDFIKLQIKLRDDSEYVSLFDNGDHSEVLDFIREKYSLTKKSSLLSKRKYSGRDRSPLCSPEISKSSNISPQSSDIMLDDFHHDSPVDSHIDPNTQTIDSTENFQTKRRIKSFPMSLITIHGNIGLQGDKLKHGQQKETTIPNTLQSNIHLISAVNSFSKRLPSSFKIGEGVDVAVDDIYCPATIVQSTEMYVRIHYLGWDSCFDTNIHDMSILYPPFSYVQRVKVWAGLSNKIPYWPCVAYIRPAVKNSPNGVAYLKSERCIFVVPALQYLKLPELEEWAGGRWLDTYSFLAFSRNFARKRPLQASLEGYLTRAMIELERDEESRSLPALRFIGSYEHYTSIELWSEKKVLPSSSKGIQNSNNQKSQTEKSRIRSKNIRGCNLIVTDPPRDPHEGYITLCSSAVALKQLESFNSSLGKSSRLLCQEEIQRRVEQYLRENASDTDIFSEDNKKVVGMTYVLGEVGCRIDLRFVHD